MQIFMIIYLWVWGKSAPTWLNIVLTVILSLSLLIDFYKAIEKARY